jgi:hypothetical protein
MPYALSFLRLRVVITLCVWCVPRAQALTTTGPLVINVDASSWHAYESGVFDGCNQTNPDINHVVQVTTPSAHSHSPHVHIHIHTHTHEANVH